MAIWAQNLDITDVWDTETPANIARVTAARLKSLNSSGNPSIDSLRDNIIRDFENLAHDSEVDADEFDIVMESLYDWADLPNGSGKRVCWIKTF